MKQLCGSVICVEVNNEKEAESALKKVNRQESVENIIKECLRVLMG